MNAQDWLSSFFFGAAIFLGIVGFVYAMQWLPQEVTFLQTVLYMVSTARGWVILFFCGAAGIVLYRHLKFS